MVANQMTTICVASWLAGCGKTVASPQRLLNIFLQPTHNALRRAENPDIVVKHYHPGACNSGNQALTADTAIASRQVFDVLEPKIVVIEHRAMVAGA
jgi:hypothetical protein